MTTSVNSNVGPRRDSWRQHAWAALLLAAITLAFFAGIDYGNSLGNDDWMHLYRTCIVRTPEIADRPFALLSLYTFCPFLRADLSLYHFVLIGFRVASAFLLYLLVWQLSRQALFSFACGTIFSTFLVKDAFFIYTYLQQNDHVFSQLLVLLTLNAFVYYFQSQTSGLYKIIELFISLLLLSLTLLVREAALPLLVTIPLLVLIFARDYSRVRLSRFALWYGTILILVTRYIWIFRSGSSYPGGTLQDVDLTHIYMASKNQLDFAFRPVLQLTISDVYQFRVAIFLTIGIVILGFLDMRRYQLPAEGVRSISQSSLRYLVWIVAGILAAWLGFAAFLLTIYASSPIRTHILSVAGESVALASAIWLLSSVPVHSNWRTLIQIGGLIWIGSHGVITASAAQQEMYGFSAAWESPAYFFRSLANLVPSVKGQTLFVYIENPDTDETPFIAGWNFQYGIRYFYADQATGIVPTDSIFGSWQVSDEGIQMQEIWVNTPHTFGWGEIIFVTRETSGRVFILDKLPERFLTAYRQSLYHPFDRVASAFIPTRIRESFPLLSGPDWTGENTQRR